MTDYSLRSAIYDVYVELCKSLCRQRGFWKGANGTPDINEWWNMEKERGCEQERKTGMKVNEKKRWAGEEMEGDH